MIRAALKTFAQAVREDFAEIQRNQKKYHGEEIGLHRLPYESVKKIGFQMMVATRVMRLAKDLGVPAAPMVVSRVIRHWYAAEIHWNAEVAPGVSIVHGNGLVLSHRAKVGPGCILFHNVTLGEGLDPDTKESGAPTLEENVHIGPGATLIGPITIGAGTKIMAGAVVTKSVPPNSLVKPAEIEVSARKGPKLKSVSEASEGTGS